MIFDETSLTVQAFTARLTTIFAIPATHIVATVMVQSFTSGSSTQVVTFSRPTGTPRFGGTSPTLARS